MKNNEYTFGLERKESEEAIKAFLEQGNEAKVFAIKGDWGIGKTHLITSILSSNNQQYYYASVFGVSTIEELRIQLWSNYRSVGQSNDSESNKLRFRKWFKPIRDNSQDIGSLIKELPIGDHGVGLAPAAISLASNVFLSNFLKRKLICIDDLERRSRKLPLEELLGFIENLSEEKECKVILIYNESKIALDSESTSILKDYREKVIDYEIKLDPNLVENFNIGFGENDPDKEIVFNYLSQETVQVKNIRIFKKLRWNLEKLRPHIADFLPRVREKIINEIIFITLSKLDSNFVINLDYLVSLGDFSEILSENNNKKRDFYMLACSLGYTDSHISNEIIRLVETSFCDYKKFHEEGVRLNDRENRYEMQEKFHEACKPFLESFKPAEKELQDNIKAFLDSYYSLLDFREITDLKDISDTIDLDISSYAEKWARYRIESYSKLEDLYSLRLIVEKNGIFELAGLVPDLEEKIATFEQNMSINEILVSMIRNESWSENDLNYLNTRTLDQWKQWLMEEGPDKDLIINHGLKAGEEFSGFLREAIINLSKENDLNALRAKRIYKVALDNIELSAN
ncbi:MAG: P-loop NTPase fold protein [Thainema sp.]